MQLTKFTHSCVRISDDGDRRLVIDPGSFSETSEALEGVDHVLITHQHADHLDVAAIRQAASGNSALALWGPKDVIDQLSAFPELEGRLTAVGPGESFVAGGLPVRTFGGQHALIHSSIPVVQNVAYLVGEAVYHPGDSYTVPTAAVEVLLIPLNAPWAKVAETIDFTIAARAPRAFQIHDALLGDLGKGIYGTQLTRIAQLYQTTDFAELSPRQTVEV